MEIKHKGLKKKKKLNQEKNNKEQKQEKETLQKKIDLTNNIKEINDFLLNAVQPHNKGKLKYYESKVKQLIALESKNNTMVSKNNTMELENNITENSAYNYNIMKSIEIELEKKKTQLQYLEDAKKQLENYKKKIRQQYENNNELRQLTTTMKKQIQQEIFNSQIENTLKKKILEESHMWQNSYYLESYPFFIDKKFPEKTTLNLISTNDFLQLINNVIPQKLFPSYFSENEIKNFLCNNQSMLTIFSKKTTQLPNLEIMLFWTLTCINSFCIHFEKIISYHVNTLPTLGVVFLKKNLNTNVLALYLFQYLFDLENILTLEKLFQNDQAKKTLWDCKRKVYSCCTNVCDGSKMVFFFIRSKRNSLISLVQVLYFNSNTLKKIKPL